MSQVPVDIESILPDPTYRIHAARLIHARPERVWNELATITMRQLPLSSALTLIRHAPALLTRRETSSSASTFFDATPIPVVLSQPPRLIVSAGPSQPWKLFGGEPAECQP